MRQPKLGYTWDEYGIGAFGKGLLQPSAWIQTALLRAVGERNLCYSMDIPTFATSYPSFPVYGQSTGVYDISSPGKFMFLIDNILEFLYPQYLNLYKFPSGKLPVGEIFTDRTIDSITWNASSMYQHLYNAEMPIGYSSNPDMLENITPDDIPEKYYDYYIYTVNYGFIKVGDYLDKTTAPYLYNRLYSIITQKASSIGGKYFPQHRPTATYFYLWAWERVQIINSLTHAVIGYSLSDHADASKVIVPYRSHLYYSWDDITKPSDFKCVVKTNRSPSEFFGTLRNSPMADAYSTLFTLKNGGSFPGGFYPTWYYRIEEDTSTRPSDNILHAVEGAAGRQSYFMKPSEFEYVSSNFEEFGALLGSSYFSFFADNPTVIDGKKIKAFIPKDFFTSQNVQEQWNGKTTSSYCMVLNFMLEPNTEDKYSAGFKFRQQ